MTTQPNTQLTGKELLLNTLRHQPQPAVPWVPFAGVHAGRLKGYNATEVLTDGDKLLASLLAVNEMYDPDGQPVIFDLQVEAEILGCTLRWADDSPPAVATHPLTSDTTIPDRLPTPADGRLPMILEVMRQMKQQVGDHTALYGLITGPFTLASHLRGTEIFMDVVLNEAFLQELMAYTTRVARRMAELYIEAGMDVIAVVDPLVSQIGPHHFEQFCSTPFNTVFSAIREQGVLSSFFVCGDATKNVEVMCQTGPDSISIDENIDMVTARQITDRYNITIAGNLPLTTTMLLGSQQDNMKYVVDLLERVDNHNLIVSPGCDMPFATPPENVVGALEAVRSPQSVRKLLANYEAADTAAEVELPDYANLNKVLVEVFTVDSASCPACGYMATAAFEAAGRLNGYVECVEYKITEAENVARVKQLGIQKLPSILINGELKYSSIIPGQQELITEIQKHTNGHGKQEPVTEIQRHTNGHGKQEPVTEVQRHTNGRGKQEPVTEVQSHTNGHRS
jgi:uroporphyrinogen decarboxylase